MACQSRISANPPPRPPAPPLAPSAHQPRAARAPWTRSFGRSEFQSTIRDLIRRFDTSQRFCRFRAADGCGAGPISRRWAARRSSGGLLTSRRRQRDHMDWCKPIRPRDYSATSIRLIALSNKPGVRRRRPPPRHASSQARRQHVARGR
jgi:hypothetical protein